MTNTYFATFFTHYDALHFSKSLKEEGVPARPMPVPRKLSSSCGTCVRFELPEGENYAPYQRESVEQLAVQEGDGYRILWDNRG